MWWVGIPIINIICHTIYYAKKESLHLGQPYDGGFNIKWLIEQFLKNVIRPVALLSVVLLLLVLVLAGCQRHEKPLKPHLDAESSQACACGDQEVVVHISTHKLPEIERRAIWRWFFENGTPVEPR